VDECETLVTIAKGCFRHFANIHTRTIPATNLSTCIIMHSEKCNAPFSHYLKPFRLRRFSLCCFLSHAAMETYGGGKRKMLLALLFLPLISTVRSSSAIRFRSVRGAAERQILMRDGAAFKIGLFADLHFGEDAWTDWGPRQDINSINVMNSVLHRENPGDVTLPVTAFTLSSWMRVSA